MFSLGASDNRKGVSNNVKSLIRYRYYQYLNENFEVLNYNKAG